MDEVINKIFSFESDYPVRYNLTNFDDLQIKFHYRLEYLDKDNIVTLEIKNRTDNPLNHLGSIDDIRVKD